MGLLGEGNQHYQVQCVKGQFYHHTGRERGRSLGGTQDPIQFIFTEGISLPRSSSKRGKRGTACLGLKGKMLLGGQTPPSQPSSPGAQCVVWCQLSVDSSPTPLALAGPFVVWEESRMGKCNTSILGNLPKPSPRPLTDPTAVPCIYPSRPLPAQPESFDTGSSFAHRPGTVPCFPAPPTAITHKIPTQFLSTPLEARRGSRAGSRKSPTLQSGPFCSSSE